MSATLASSTAVDGPSRNHRRGADGDLHAGGQHLAAQCGLALYPRLAVDGRRRGRLDIYFVYHGERHHHDDGALACGSLRPKGDLSDLDRHLCARPCARDACDDPDAIHRRPRRPRWRKRHPRSAVDGDPARYAAALAARPHKPGGGRNPAAWPPQRSQHRRLAQRISRLALDVLCRPANGGVHLPGHGALASGEAGRRRIRPSISSA